MHTFYKKLNEFSYYNAFFRVKGYLLEKGLIRITRKKGRKYINLTKKGIDIYNKLVEIEAMIKKKKTKND